MLLRQCIERSTVGLAFIAGLLGAHPAVAQAPPRRRATLGHSRIGHPPRRRPGRYRLFGSA